MYTKRCMVNELPQEESRPITPAEQNTALAEFYKSSYDRMVSLGHGLLFDDGDFNTQKLAALLESAKVNPAMKEWIVRNFGLSFVSGTAQQEDTRPKWVDFTAQGEGMFSEDENKLMKIEKTAYKEIERRLLKVYELHGDSLERLKQAVEQFSGRSVNAVSPSASILSRWREQYIARYGDEP